MLRRVTLGYRKSILAITKPVQISTFVTCVRGK